MRRKRVEILLRIEQMEKSRCAKCTESSTQNNTFCSCMAAKEVRRLGNQLMKLTNERNVPLLDTLKGTGSEVMTKEMYEELKELHVMDKDIRKVLGLTPAIWFNLKRSLGVMKDQARKGVGK